MESYELPEEFIDTESDEADGAVYLDTDCESGQDDHDLF